MGKIKHSGGWLSKAAKTLANPKASKAVKTKAGHTLKAHQDKYH